jgi:hypothetical protein
MSKPITLPWPPATAVRTMPTMPPAGPDRMASLPWKRCASVRPPLLHEEQAHARHLLRHLLDIAAQDRRQVGVDHGGVAARHQLHQRAHLVRRADLREAHLARAMRAAACSCAGQRQPCMKHDGHARRPASCAPAALSQPPHLVQRPDHVAVRADALVGLDHHAFVQQLGQHDVAVEQPRPVLVGDAQRVAEAARGDQQRAVALALEQRIGGHRGAHLHAVHLLGRDRLHPAPGRAGGGCPRPRRRGTAPGSRSAAWRVQRAVGRAADHVGEGAATVDPELPALGAACNAAWKRTRKPQLVVRAAAPSATRACAAAMKGASSDASASRTTRCGEAPATVRQRTGMRQLEAWPTSPGRRGKAVSSISTPR